MHHEAPLVACLQNQLASHQISDIITQAEHGLVLTNIIGWQIGEVQPLVHFELCLVHDSY